uniref:Uncharacterized protein n=1 Tax=Tanacetum cinerariifolium TaxID=118510 RepID=A0A6L2MTM3_TANCI|nr:hypothetical protein [Tanacetum cinerariifolium]
MVKLLRELSFTNQFFVEKPQEEEPEKTNTKSEALIPTSTATTSTVTTTITHPPPPPPQPQQSITNQTLLKCIATALSSTYATPAENSLLAKTGDITTFMKRYCCKVKKIVLTQSDYEGQRMKLLKLSTQMSFTFSSRWRNVTSCLLIRLTGRIREMKAARYLDFGLELLVLEQLWIDDVYMILRRVEKKSEHICEFSVSSASKSTQDTGHLDHLPGSDKRMLSTTVKLWTQNLVIRQWVEDFQLGIESYQTQLNLTKPRWDAKDNKFKPDYTIIESHRAVVFPVNNNT